jgi:hypothetical protein
MFATLNLQRSKLVSPVVRPYTTILKLATPRISVLYTGG